MGRMWRRYGRRCIRGDGGDESRRFLRDNKQKADESRMRGDMQVPYGMTNERGEGERGWGRGVRVVHPMGE